MVQALAFAEIFLGLIFATAGYKAVSVGNVVRGEAGEDTPPAGLGASAALPSPPVNATSTGSTPGVTLPGAQGSEIPLYPAVAAAKGLLEAQLHRTVQVGEVGSLYDRYHPEKASRQQNHPPSTSFESLTGAVEP